MQQSHASAAGDENSEFWRNILISLSAVIPPSRNDNDEDQGSLILPSG